MTDLFLEVVNRSISAGYLVLLIAGLRLVFRRMPKWVTVLLWGFVAFRLLCPVDLQSSLSLIPSARVVSREMMLSPVPSVQTGLPGVDATVNPVIGESFAPNPAASANPLQIWIPVLGQIWLLGMAFMGLYTVASYLRLRRRVSCAVRLAENIYQSEAVASPFILGLLSPRIYLPYGITREEREYVITHEKTHLRRKDHWWKPLGFGLLMLTWFHPLMWAAYILLCRDIELACDEAAVKKMQPLQRAEYSQTLLHLSIPRRQIAACPLAFGEIGVKERVKRVLSYKKPGFWVLILCLVLCAAIAVFFLTSPSEKGLEMLHALEEDNIVSIQSATYRPEPLGTTFYGPEDQNLHRILPVLTQARGTPISRPWGADENSVQLITIFQRKNSEIIQVRIVENRYLKVDNYWYEADPAWLATVPADKDHYTWLTTLSRDVIEKVEFLPEPGSNVYEADPYRLAQYLNLLHIPAIGYPETLPPRWATYRITTVDGVIREVAILGGNYLMVDDVLYEVGGQWMLEFTSSPDPLDSVPLPGGLTAAALRVGRGERLALLREKEQLDRLLDLLNQGVKLDVEDENMQAEALVTLYWNNGDVRNLPLSDYGAYFGIGGNVYYYGTFDSRDAERVEALWQLFGFDMPVDNYDFGDLIGPGYLKNDLFGEAVVMPADTLAVSAGAWMEDHDAQPEPAWALTRQDGRYALCSLEGTGIRTRYYQRMDPVEQEGKLYYVLHSSRLPVTDLSKLETGDFLMIVNPDRN